MVKQSVKDENKLEQTRGEEGGEEGVKIRKSWANVLFECLLAEEMLFQEICASYESLMNRDHWNWTPSLSYGAESF